MGIFDRFRRGGSSAYEVVEIPSASINYEQITAILAKVTGMTPAQLWRSQPNVRTVIDFLARNIAQLSLQTFERADDGDRSRLRDSPAAKLLANPNKAMTGYELIRSLVSDLALYDEAWWLVVQNESAGWEIRPLANHRVSILSGAEINGNLVIQYTENARSVVIPGENIIHFGGWTPGYGDHGSPVVETLKDVLAEQVAAAQFRAAIWKNGGQVGQYITRPKDAAVWSDEAARRFKEGMDAYKAGGGKAGGMPILEDGMGISQVRFNAREEQWIEAAQLALETVARIFHINPAMLGATGGISYANVREFRKMLYGETLGPWLKMIQDRINQRLLPMIGEASNVYVEFNIKAKLAGDFLEQAAVMSSAIGRPWMTADEGRAMDNRSALGGDAAQLVTPLNVLVGGQASPRDSAPKSGRILTKRDPIKLKGEPSRESEKTVEKILSQFFKRQRVVVLGKINAKADAPWWDQERWDKELAEDLYKAAVSVTGQVASDTLDSIGEDPDAYDMGRTQKFLQAVAESRAGMINKTTAAQIQDAIDNAEDDEYEGEANSPEHAFDVAEEGRGNGIAQTLLTTFAGFAVTEAVKQIVSPRAGATKTWVVMSGNPRSEHAAMDGETVSMDDTFSNSANWPGDPILGADGVSNCMCGVEITVP